MLDMKPQNILVFGANQHRKTLKLCDFGLSRSGPTNDATRLDLSRLPGGTLRYAPPDQMRTQSVMPANDVYSFGVILFFFVCRTEPWKDANFGQIANGRLIDTFAPVDDCPPAYADLCRRCIDPDPAKRPKDAIEVQRELNDMNFQGMVPSEFGSSTLSVGTGKDENSQAVEETEFFQADYSEY